MPRLRNSSQVGSYAAIIYGQYYYQQSDVPTGPLAMVTKHSVPILCRQLYTSISGKAGTERIRKIGVKQATYS